MHLLQSMPWIFENNEQIKVYDSLAKDSFNRLFLFSTWFDNHLSIIALHLVVKSK